MKIAQRLARFSFLAIHRRGNVKPSKVGVAKVRTDLARLVGIDPAELRYSRSIDGIGEDTYANADQYAYSDTNKHADQYADPH
jgi:hypothetical protein